MESSSSSLSLRRTATRPPLFLLQKKKRRRHRPWTTNKYAVTERRTRRKRQRLLKTVHTTTTTTPPVALLPSPLYDMQPIEVDMEVPLDNDIVEEEDIYPEISNLMTDDEDSLNSVFAEIFKKVPELLELDIDALKCNETLVEEDDGAAPLVDPVTDGAAPLVVDPVTALKSVDKNPFVGAPDLAVTVATTTTSPKKFEKEKLVGEKPYMHVSKATCHMPITCSNGMKCKFVEIGSTIMYKCSILEGCLFLRAMRREIAAHESRVLKLDEMLEMLTPKVRNSIKKVVVSGCINATDIHVFNLNELKASEVCSSKVVDALIGMKKGLQFDGAHDMDVAAAVVARMCELELERRIGERDAGLYCAICESSLKSLYKVIQATAYRDFDRAVMAMVLDAKNRVDEAGSTFDNFILDLYTSIVTCMEEGTQVELTIGLVDAFALAHFKDSIMDQTTAVMSSSKARALLTAVREKDYSLLAHLGGDRCDDVEASACNNNNASRKPYRKFGLNTVFMNRDEITALFSTLVDSDIRLEYLEFDSCVMVDKQKPLLILNEPIDINRVHFTNSIINNVCMVAVLELISPNAAVTFHDMPLSQFHGFDRTVFPLLKSRQQRSLKVSWSCDILANTATEMARTDMSPNCLMYTAARYLRSACLYPYFVACVGNVNAIYSEGAIVERKELCRLPVGSEINFTHVHCERAYRSVAEEVATSIGCPSCYAKGDEVHLVYGAEDNGRAVEVKAGGLIHKFQVRFGHADLMYMDGYKPRLDEAPYETSLPPSAQNITLINVHSWLNEQMSGSLTFSSNSDLTKLYVVRALIREARELTVTSTEPGMLSSGMMHTVCRAIVANARAYQKQHYGAYGLVNTTVIHESITFDLVEDLQGNVDAGYERARALVTKMMHRLLTIGLVFEVSLKINGVYVLSRHTRCVQDIAYSGTVLCVDDALVLPNAGGILDLIMYASGKKKDCDKAYVANWEKYKHSKWFRRFFVKHVYPGGCNAWREAIYEIMKMCTDPSAPFWRALYGLGMRSSAVEEDFHDLVSIMRPPRQRASLDAPMLCEDEEQPPEYFYNVHRFAREIEKHQRMLLLTKSPLCQAC